MIQEGTGGPTREKETGRKSAVPLEGEREREREEGRVRELEGGKEARRGGSKRARGAKLRKGEKRMMMMKSIVAAAAVALALNTLCVESQILTVLNFFEAVAQPQYQNEVRLHS